MERRKTSRKQEAPHILRVQLPDGMGQSRWVTVDLREKSDYGIGISAAQPLPVGEKISIRGKLGENQSETTVRAQIQWCAEQPTGGFRAGLEFLDEDGRSKHKFANTDYEAPRSVPQEVDIDCYEVMQLSPNADTDTVDRVYRYLAKRLHPDNSKTGNQELFLQLNQAYDVLKDPVRRAAYDAKYQDSKRVQWNIFDPSKVASGVDAESRKRDGILGLLYSKMLHDPYHATIPLLEFEQLLGCPREHLQTALWYLKGKSYVQRSDNGRYSLTVEGFEVAEENLRVAPATSRLKRIRAQ